MIKSKKLASAIAVTCAMTLAPAVSADQVEDLHKEERAIHDAAVKSQKRVDSMFEQSVDLLSEYRQVVDETDNLRMYNDHVQKLVNNQEKKIQSLQNQIDGIEDTKKGVVPLMYKMLDSLEKFIELDIPVEVEARKARVERIRELMSDPDITTSERYRQVLEAYQIENDYGSAISAYQGKLNDITVDMVHIGRVALIAQSLDLKNSWVWDNDARTWVELGDEYNKPVTKIIRMAKKQVAPDLIEVPVFAAESAE
ncbi:DUF3450 domain-containing protein [Gayadomonas joobiniege]|uniref:DUF3450 domain-containing protein n=1 Tax=Gayadomonas joobiniege TaxID=1234606 RepID=UPI00037905BE|nr:DUF3450 domain-containing protein [Gayadomonas joobiniege]